MCAILKLHCSSYIESVVCTSKLTDLESVFKDCTIIISRANEFIGHIYGYICCFSILRRGREVYEVLFSP